MIDRFGRNIVKTTENGEDIYTVDGGLVLRFPQGWDENRALDSINAMAPEGYIAPTNGE